MNRTGPPCSWRVGSDDQVIMKVSKCDEQSMFRSWNYRRSPVDGAGAEAGLPRGRDMIIHEKRTTNPSQTLYNKCVNEEMQAEKMGRCGSADGRGCSVPSVSCSKGPMVTKSEEWTSATVNCSRNLSYALLGPNGVVRSCETKQRADAMVGPR